MMHYKRFYISLGAVLFILNLSLACTGIQLKSQDGSFINGRTVEFGVRLDLNGLVVPRNYQFTGTTPTGKNGLSYRSKYAAIGFSAFNLPAIVDGFNEKGLTAAMFYFENYAEYTPITTINQNCALAPDEFPNWVLTQFATVNEVKQAIKNNSVFIVPTARKVWGGVPPMHYIIYDKNGKSIVIEPVEGHLVVYDNPIGVITNSPTFEWQMTNLSNYMNLSPVNVSNSTIHGVKLKQFGQGSGLLGLPGDFTPPSRFVRAAFFSSNATQTKNAKQSVFLAFHLLNNFDIPPGSVQETKAIGNKFGNIDITLATTVKDPVNRKYYYKTFDDQNIKSFDLNQFDLGEKKLRLLHIKRDQ